MAEAALYPTALPLKLGSPTQLVQGQERKNKSSTASWLLIHCAKVVLKEKLPFHRRSSGRTVLLFLFTLPDATRKLHSR